MPRSHCPWIGSNPEPQSNGKIYTAARGAAALRQSLFSGGSESAALRAQLGALEIIPMVSKHHRVNTHLDTEEINLADIPQVIHETSVNDERTNHT